MHVKAARMMYRHTVISAPQITTVPHGICLGCQVVETSAMHDAVVRRILRTLCENTTGLSLYRFPIEIEFHHWHESATGTVSRMKRYSPDKERAPLRARMLLQDA